jgi:hypothetical protein
VDVPPNGGSACRFLIRHPEGVVLAAREAITPPHAAQHAPVELPEAPAPVGGLLIVLDGHLRHHRTRNGLVPLRPEVPAGTPRLVGGQEPAAEETEALMWVLVSGVLKDPERLRRGLDDMLEREIGAGSLRPQDEDAERWLRSLSELDAQEERLLDLYLEGKLETKRYESRASRLKKSRKTVKGELERIVNTGSLASSG